MKDNNYIKALECYKSNKNKKALALLDKIKIHSTDSLKLSIFLNLKINNYHKVINLCLNVLKKTSKIEDKLEYYDVLGTCYQKLGEPEQAILYYEESVKINQTVINAKVMASLFWLYFESNQFSKAEYIASSLLTWENYYIEVSLALLKIASFQDNKELLSIRAKRLIPQINKLDLEGGNIFISFLIALDLFEQATEVIAKFEVLHNIVATSLRADLLIKQKKFNEVIGLVSRSKNRDSRLLYCKAEALDKLNNPNLAFDTYIEASSLKINELSGKKLINNVPLWEKVVDKNTRKNKMIFNFDDESQRHKKFIFIFGFPRSGTTLIDNILDTQERVLVLSEKGILDETIRGFNTLNKKYPTDIINLTKKDIDYLRELYLKAISNRGYKYELYSHIVDKGPHHTEALPLIHLLFPKAKLIATIRHPFDVCLSCFQQNFEFNDHNAHLITIDGIVNRYKQIFTLLERYQEQLKIPVKEIRYEDLVTNFDEIMVDLFDYLGVEPTERFDNFHDHAAKKFINSASRGQTDKALYTDSMYKWHKYEEHLLPYKEQLGYFIEKYGYQNS